MEQPRDEWAARVSAVIAGEVRRYRTAKGMSAQQTADACAAIGAPIPRSVLSNLENGRRESVSVTEVLTLAKALDVPPIALVFPAGYAETVEALPHVHVDPLEAADWFNAERKLDPLRDPLDDQPQDQMLQEAPINMQKRARALARALKRLYRNELNTLLDKTREIDPSTGMLIEVDTGKRLKKEQRKIEQALVDQQQHLCDRGLLPWKPAATEERTR